jgi:hypothetical protein
MTTDLGYADVIPNTQQIRLELKSRPGRYLSAALLSELTGLTLAEVHHAIYVLTKQRKIIRRVPSGMARANCHQSYAWDYRGMH